MVEMGDVTDRAYLPARSGVIGSRENNICSALGGSITEDLYSIIRNVTPLPVSKNYTAKEVDEIMQSVVKVAGNSSVDWEKRMNVVSNKVYAQEKKDEKKNFSQTEVSEVYYLPMPTNNSLMKYVSHVISLN